MLAPPPPIEDATPYLGETAALGCAMMWATSSMAFGVAARIVGGFALNQFRIFAAWPLLALWVFVTFGTLWPAGLDGERATLLLLSGFIGVTLGDIGYFHSLATIGPRLGSVILSTWPVVVVLATPLAGERLRLATLPGVLATVAGVAVVLWCARGGSTWSPGLTRRQWWLGVAGGVLASVGQAVGYLLARRAMAASELLPAGLDPLAATLVRMTAGLVGIQIVATLQRRPTIGAKVLRDRRALLGALIGTVMGPVLGIWLSMVAAHRCADPGVGAALMGVFPLFVLPLAWFFYRSRVTLFTLLGTLLTVGGAAWLMLQQAD